MGLMCRKEELGKSIREMNLFNAVKNIIILAFRMNANRFKAMEYDPNDENKGCPYVPRCIETVVHRGHDYEVLKDDYHMDVGLSQVTQGNQTYEVDFSNFSCSCAVPQQTKLPCIHMIAILHTKKLYSSVVQLIPHNYLKRNAAKTTMQVDLAESVVKDIKLIVPSSFYLNFSGISIGRKILYERFRRRYPSKSERKKENGRQSTALIRSHNRSTLDPECTLGV